MEGVTAMTEVYGFSQELISDIKDALAQRDREKLLNLLEPQHVSDIADFIEAITPQQRYELIDLVSNQLDPEILARLDQGVREDLLEHLAPTAVAAAVVDLESDDAALILDDLEDEQQREVLQALPEDERAEMQEVLNYPEDSAARLMQRNMVAVPDSWTIGQILDSFENNDELPEHFNDVYVIDHRGHPIGGVPLNRLLRHRRREAVHDIMETEIKPVPLTMNQEEVTYLFNQYELDSTPVVNEEGQMIGIITVDDIVDVIQEKATEDFMHLGGVAESDFHSTILRTAFGRLRWLLVTFFDTLIASYVIYQFRDTIEQVVALAILMPIVAAMGGNAGMQVMTVTVRALATKEMAHSQVWRVVRKELSVAALNGLVFASLLALIASVWFKDIKLGIILASAMIFNTVWAGFAGTAFPTLLHRFDLDPAISAGPILTTTTDVLGFASFLWLATIFLL